MPIQITKKQPNPIHRPSKWRSFLGGIICLSLSLMGFWVAFYGEDIQGGLPFVAEAANQVIGRILIGVGAVIAGCWRLWRLGS